MRGRVHVALDRLAGGMEWGGVGWSGVRWGVIGVGWDRLEWGGVGWSGVEWGIVGWGRVGCYWGGAGAARSDGLSKVRGNGKHLTCDKKMTQ